MANHVHLIVTPADHRQLARFVQGAAQPYAQYRNKRRGGSGKLFEQRYGCVAIVDERQLAATTAYVDLNPVRAGIHVCPLDFPWSTCRLHCGVSRVDPTLSRVWTPSVWYLGLSGHAEGRAIAYRDLLDCYAREDDWSDVAREREPPGAKTTDRRRFERPNRKTAI